MGDFSTGYGTTQILKTALKAAASNGDDACGHAYEQLFGEEDRLDAFTEAIVAEPDRFTEICKEYGYAS